jgi:hypothetical protein
MEIDSFMSVPGGRGSREVAGSFEERRLAAKIRWRYSEIKMYREV